MSDQGEKTCPLCAEEMDLTDQQLKPCKCGYDICVWCWNHIMDIAEKDETEGLCPACRSPYDKEKIVKTAENCERLVAEINTDRKMKFQKTKINKSCDGRKQLSNLRVIRRNLVYVVGFPFDHADEDLLQEKEYFGQYGKVLKVSMSRTTAGVIQLFPNNCCNVYITYSKEEEAIRCIQSVHGFVLDGRSLKACFGTTKYCHAWLRNTPCTNSDCLYLHEFGLEEDSFTKDEIISGCTRNRVQQITGITNNLQRRSGDMLPPPSDDFYIDDAPSYEKPPIRNASNNSVSIVRVSPPNSSSGIVRVSPPNSSSGRSTALPAGASWGARASSCQPPVASAACSNGHSKQKLDNVSGPSGTLSAFSSKHHASTENGDLEKKVVLKEGHSTKARVKVNKQESIKQPINMVSQTRASEYQVTANGDLSKAGHRKVEVNDVGISVPPEILNFDDLRGENCDSMHVMDRFVSDNGKTQIVCSEIASMSIGSDVRDDQSCVARPDTRTNLYYTERVGEQLDSATVSKTAKSFNDRCLSSTHELKLNSHSHEVENSELEDDLQSFNAQRLKDPEFISSNVPKSDHSLHLSNHSREPLLHYTDSHRKANFNADPTYGNRHSQGSLSHSFGSSKAYTGYPDDLISRSNRLDRAVQHPYMPSDGSQMYRSNAANDVGIDMGENSIISNMLSMDFDAWDDPLTSNQNLAKLLGETNKQSGSLVRQNSNQSRFSFARQEESKSQEFHADLPFNIGRVSRNHSNSQDFGDNRAPYHDKLGNVNSMSTNDMGEYIKLCGSQSVFPSSNLSVSRAQVSAPPGFSVQNRAPPPGFSSHERMDLTFDALTGGPIYNNSSLTRNSYQSLPNNSIGDVEFIDPAIMAVGGRLPAGIHNPVMDRKSSFPSQYASFENDARLQLLMQRTAPPQQQNLRFGDVGNVFSPSSNAQPRFMEQQTQANNVPQFSQHSLQQSRNGIMSNGHWDGWHDSQSANNIDMTHLLRNERLGGYNKFYDGYEDSNFRMPSSGDLYNRTFGM